MARRRVVRRPTPILLGLSLLTGVMRTPLAAAQTPPEHGSPPPQAQPLPDFRASTVMLTERKNGHTRRRTQAESARLCGHEIVAEQVIMQVLDATDGSVHWTLTAPSARLSTHQDAARFGPVRLVCDDGEQWWAQGGQWDGARRQLSLMGPACGGRGGHSVCAQFADITFGQESSEVASIALHGRVEGQIVPPGPRTP